MLLSRIRLLVAVAWAGSLWTVGYLAAPTLFATLGDRALAGTIAGSMFHVQAMVSLVCGMLLMLLLWLATPDWRAVRRRKVLAIIAGMLLCTVAVHFGLQPMMAELRATGLAEEAVKSRFGLLHGVSSVIYLVQSVLAVWLLVSVAD
jgi:hypothetical protein